MNFNVDIHTDGACSGNPGPMGIGVVLVDMATKREKEISESIGHGTNNQAEFIAAIKGLKAIKHPNETEARLITDSQLIIGIMCQHWKAKVNLDLVKELRDVCSTFKKVTFVKVKGHAGDKYNEMCDKLARNAIK